MLTVMTPEELLSCIAAAFAPLDRPPETVRLDRALGRVLARDILADQFVPGFCRSTVDGYALRGADTFGCSESIPALLAQVGAVEMGREPTFSLDPGQCAAIPTGGALPKGADAVQMVEHTEDFGGGEIGIYKSVPPGANLIFKGDDVKPGDRVLEQGRRLEPQDIGALAALGVTAAPVVPRLRIGLLSTGDELVPPETAPGPGQVRDVNGPLVAALVAQAGAEPVWYGIVPDREEVLRQTVERALEQCDGVVLSGGSSVGEKDAACRVLASLGEVLCHGLAIRPGKPAILGRRGPVPVLGVPGYPVSGILVLEFLLRPLIEGWTGKKAPAREQAEAVLARRVVSGLKYREFVRVRLGQVGDRLVASPLARGAGVVSSFLKADGILDVPQGQEGIEAGETVTVSLLRPREELEHTLVMMGSHDPLLDEVADLLHQSHPELYMSSTHVGSMGGIMALRRGEAHGAGCHLLNEADGSYNTAYLEKYFPNGGVYQVECVGRTQGLMVAKGNPLNIKGFGDIARPGLRYVNRQKGSGTRILADYLCRKEGVDQATVYGYDREELTHTSVAAQIAAGTADAGMGILSAARLYDLEFLPVCVEQYDLLIPDFAWDTPVVKALLEVLAGPAFRARLKKLGGYTMDRPGRVRRHFRP